MSTYPNSSPGPHDPESLRAAPALVPAPVMAYAPMFQPPSIRPPRRHNQEPDLNPGFLWSTWCRWWKVLVPVSLLLIVSVCGGILFLTSPVYRAEAALTISPYLDYILTPNSREESARSFVQTQLDFLRSSVVLSKILARPEVASLELMKRNDAVKWLGKRLEVVTSKDSDFCRVAVKTTDPDASATLVNAIVDTYLELQEAKETKRNSSRIKKLTGLLSEQEQEVTNRQAELQQLLSAALEKDPSARTPGDDRILVNANPLSDLQKKLQETDLDISLLQADIQGLRENSARPSQQGQLEMRKAVESDPLLVQQKAILHQKREALANNANRYKNGPSNSYYMKLQKEIAKLEGRLEATRRNLTQDYAEQYKSFSQAEHEDRLDDATSQLSRLEATRDHLRDQLKSRQNELQGSSENMTEIEFAQNRYNESTTLMTEMSKRLAQLETESGAASRVQLIEEATRPRVPEPMGLLKLLLAAIGGSLVVPFGLAVLWERSACRITSADQLENQIEVPVIGEVARLPVKIKSGTRTRNASARGLIMFEESIDSIRTNLLLKKEQQGLQVIAVCSSVAAEGKTSVSSQLAISLARATGQPTLLIDGDMRAPDLHGVFEIPNEPGLIHVLGGTVAASAAINREWSEHVHILPAGNLTKSPHNLLGQSQFQRLLDDLRGQYRYIVVDTPPVLAASEALIMAAAADGVLVCTMHEKSRGDHLRLTHDRLVAAGAKPLGTVLNGVSTRSYAYKYGSYYYYGDNRNRYAYSQS